VFYSGYDPVGLVYREADATAIVFIQRDGWPSNVQLCTVPDGAAAAACFAHAPSKSSRPVLDGDTLYFTSQYNVLAMDPDADETYRVVAPWADARGLVPTPEGLVFTDVDAGTLSLASPNRGAGGE